MNQQNHTMIEIQDCRLRLGENTEGTIEFHLPAFCAQTGESWAFTGPSGCGKTTLLNLIAGLMPPSSGTLRVNQQEMSRLSSYQRDRFRGRHIGFVYQSFHLLEGFSALENVLVGMRFGRTIPARERRDRAIESLKQVGLEHRLYQVPEKLSVGERQRVAVARAVANQPAILLADEPTGSLDPVTAGGVFELIVKLCEEHQCTLLMVTHDLELAQKLPNRLDCRGLVTHRTREAAA